MNKRRPLRQQKPRSAKMQKESQSLTSGTKRNRIEEEKSSKKRKNSDDVHSQGRKKNKTSVERSPDMQRDFYDDCDNYCWKCHIYSHEEKCSSCPRVYCIKCFKHVNQVCEACLQQNESEEAFSAIAETSSLLLSVIESSFPENKIKNRRLINWQPKATDAKLCHVVDYTYIDSKSKDTDGLQYRSPAELLDDVKWLYHNCVIVHGEHHDITKEAKQILKQFVEQIDDLSDCAECYRKPFLNICDTPHPLVMAKQKSFPPWPAKCLRVLESKAHVRYFGTHEMAKVPLKDCYFMSKDYVGVGRKKAKKYISAENEFLRYVNLFKESLGEYPYQPKDTPFDEQKGKDMMRAVKEKYLRAQKAKVRRSLPFSNSNTSNSNCRVIDLTEEDEYRDCKISVNAISEEIERLQPHRSNSEISDSALPFNLDMFSHLDKNVQMMIEGISMSDNPAPSYNSNNFLPSGPHNDNILPGSSMLYSPNTSSRGWLLPPCGSANESGISISNVYSGSDPHSLRDFDLNAQDTPFVINDPSPSIQTAPSFAMHSSLPAAEVENNNREDDDDCQVIADTQKQNNNLRYIDDRIIQVILFKDPGAFSILKTANNLVKQLFIQFWAMANGIKNAPEILSSQNEKIRKLRKDKSKCEDRVANADMILKSLSKSLTSECEKLQKRNKELEERNIDITKQLEYQKNCLERLQEAVNDYKKNNYCSNRKCEELATIFCCSDGMVNTNYCSRKCQKEHESIHLKLCSRQEQSNQRVYQNQAQILEFHKTVETLTVMTKK